MKLLSYQSKRAVRARAGLTLLEMSIGLVVLILLSGSILESMDSMKRMTARGTASSDIQHASDRALVRVLEDLRYSGFVELADGRSFPALIEDGSAPAGYHEDHNYDVPVKTAQAGEPAAEPDRGLIFVRFLDADGNGVPDIDWAALPSPALRWEETETISYSVRTQPDGRNALVRTVAEVEQRVVARDVERVVFDTAATVGPAEVPLGVVRIQMWFRSVDGDGVVTRSRAEASVRLRNGAAI